MNDMPEDGAQSTAEVVFVLRVRAADSGWRGQVQRLGGQNGARTRYVGGLRELFTLLEQDWQSARSTQTGPGPPDSEKPRAIR
jgi:hypothetical protein